MKIKEHLQQRLMLRSNFFKQLLKGKNLEKDTSAVIQVNNKVYPAKNGTIHTDTLHKYFTFPPITLDAVIDSVLNWQVQFDDKATKQGILNHLKEEIQEVETSNYDKDEIADLWILLIHLTAQLNLDPSYIILNKLKVLKTRNYNVKPDAQGRVKHVK